MREFIIFNLKTKENLSREIFKSIINYHLPILIRRKEGMNKMIKQKLNRIA